LKTGKNEEGEKKAMMEPGCSEGQSWPLPKMGSKIDLQMTLHSYSLSLSNPFFFEERWFTLVLW